MEAAGSGQTTSSATGAAQAPEGFVSFDAFGGYTDVNGPFHARREGDRLVFGFRVEPRHANLVGQCHGGMLMLFADILLPLSARYQADLDDTFLPTINLTSDFVASAKIGEWVEGRTEVVRVTRNLVFTQGAITADGRMVTRVNGIFKRGGVIETTSSALDLRAKFGPLEGPPSV